MSRFFFGSSSKASIHSKSDNTPASELEQLQSALQDADRIMNDDVDTAAQNLEKGSSAFHVLGQGIVFFLQAALGAEQDVMKQAADSLYKAESVAYEHQRRAERNPDAHSVAYPAGTEFVVCQAQAMVLSAVVGVMRESLTDAIRGFYKLRKALGILETVSGHERAYIERQKASKGGANGTVSSQAGSQGADADMDDGKRKLADDLTDDALLEHPIDQWIQSTVLCQYGMLLVLISLIPPAWGRLLSIVGFHGDRDRGQALLWRATAHENINGAVAALVIMGVSNGLTSFLDIKPPGFYPTARLRKLLATMRSRYPQSELLRLESARMASVERRLETCIATLGVHDGPLGEAADEKTGDGASERKALKQVMALQAFERALNCMYVHAYSLTTKCFLRCAELNNWSRALFYYLAAGAQLELYRVHQYGGVLPDFPADSTKPTPLKRVAPDATKAKQHRDRVAELYAKVPELVGKKRLLAKQLPIDTIISRKLSKWEARAKDAGIDFVDAVGVSPVEEMTFLFGGYGRMPKTHLLVSLSRLAWSDGDRALLPAADLGMSPEEAVPATNPHAAAQNNLDERAISAVLRACILRQLGRAADARTLLEESVTGHARAEFAAFRYAETWTQPMARFEIAAAFWDERYAVGAGEETVRDETDAQVSVATLRACAKRVEEVANWGSYEMDIRIGPKVTTARETLKQLGITAA